MVFAGDRHLLNGARLRGFGRQPVEEHVIREVSVSAYRSALQRLLAEMDANPARPAPVPRRPPELELDPQTVRMEQVMAQISEEDIASIRELCNRWRDEVNSPASHIADVLNVLADANESLRAALVERGRGTTGAGVDLIANERARQESEKGYTLEYDYRHDRGQLAMAAVCYASAAARTRIYTRRDHADQTSYRDPFPWDQDARPRQGNVLAVDDVSDEDAVRLLVKAGALIAAEIDRIARKPKRIARKPK